MSTLTLRRIVLLTGCAMLCFNGCSPQREATNSSSAAVGKDESHEDHDHHIPEHRPKDYPDAVRQLTRRIELVRGEARHPAHAMDELKKLRDVITWLPELAADSDLKKREWDRIHELAKRLDRLVPADVPAFLEQTAPGSASRAAITALIGELEAIQPPLRAAPAPPMSPQSRSD